MDPIDWTLKKSALVYRVFLYNHIEVLIMSKKLFSDIEIAILKKNRYVKNVSTKGITYTDEFKSYVISEIEKGNSAPKIFESVGFDIKILGLRRVHSAVSRWKKAYLEKGVMGLRDTRKDNSGRPMNREMTKEDIIRHQQAEIEYLREELELVKKLELEERSVITSSYQLHTYTKL